MQFTFRWPLDSFTWINPEALADKPINVNILDRTVTGWVTKAEYKYDVLVVTVEVEEI